MKAEIEVSAAKEFGYWVSIAILISLWTATAISLSNYYTDKVKSGKPIEVGEKYYRCQAKEVAP